MSTARSLPFVVVLGRRTVGRRRGVSRAIRLQLAEKRRTRDAEDARGLATIVAGQRKRSLHGRPLDVAKAESLMAHQRPGITGGGLLWRSW